MPLRPLQYDSPEYHALCDLRRRFLRLPVGLELTGADVAGEESQHLFGLFLADGRGERLVGGLIGKPLPDSGDSSVQMRQVVLHEDWRGRGLGRDMMASAEEELARMGYRRFVLFAREEATPFYARCGYRRTGETRELIGLEHWRMEKERR